MLNQILNRLTSSGTAQGRRGTSRSTGRRATTTRGRSASTSGMRRGVRGRGSRQSAPAQNLVSRLLRGR